ncbi:MAG: CDP-diacylglycerol--glycerol-3-phosphate 3-phosphatidyltransferase [Rhodospirillaceae bacterium]|nr:CDP-diacylglycerol--glycerol-3-phosphate 3-phosphatidyltransferase [Rhodospirillaceae bacterium]MCY4239268.1 CDP-diacylglycerol--glycerol-3-phosphate 3-phosphatidyltransferase [Rhodospirillaceae bacterium]
MPVTRAKLLQAPNLLTLTRVAVVPFFVAAFWLPSPALFWVTFALFAGASLTDWLDGWLARRNDLGTEFGRFLDPVADKILVAAALVMIVASGRLSEISVVAVIILLVRELVISGLREFLAGALIVPVSQLAKWKTATQMAATSILLISGAFANENRLLTIGECLLWLAALLTIVTGASYLRGGLRHMDE